MLNPTPLPSDPWFVRGERLYPVRPCSDWDLVVGDGPVIATAIHDGHAVRESLRSYLAIEPEQRRREEDPLTGLLTEVGDVRIRARYSRFQVDLNRPRKLAVARTPADTWGLTVWREPLPAQERLRSLDEYDRFYAMIAELIEHQLERWGCALIIDLHSYNHRRDGPTEAPAPLQDNPDIELGVTTLDHQRWGWVANRFAEVLRAQPVNGHLPDVRTNVRFPTGGYFPEWLYATWGERVCVISPEYKKVFMDEWSGQVDIAAIEALREGLQTAVDAVRQAFLPCR